jgi:hypothetical protein
MRWLLLNQCVDADPEADPSTSSPRSLAPHPPRAPPRHAHPPPRSPIFLRRSPPAPQPLRPPPALHAPPPPPAPSSHCLGNGMKRNQ